MLKRIALILIGIAAGFSVAEIVLRVTDYRISLYGQHDGVVVDLDETRLFRIPSGRGGEIDRWGCRFESNPKTSRDARIVLFGDSFVWGTGAKPGTSFAARLSQMIQPQRQVVNCGVPGYGPDQSLLLLKDRQLADPPGTESKIVFTIFAGNDFEDLLKNGITLPISPRAVSARNMVTSLLGRSRALLAIRRGWAGPGFVEKDLTDVLFFDPEVPLSENIDPEGAALRMRNVIVELKEIVPQQKILVLIIPPRCSFDKAACRENGKVVAEICRTLGIDFLDLQDRFDREPGGGASLFEVRSGHLSEGGNAVVAEELSLRLAS